MRELGTDVNSQSEWHDTIVQQLLESGTDVNAQGAHYGNALQATAYGRHNTIVQRLLKAGADINAQGGIYGSALQAAVDGGHIAIAQRLLELGPSNVYHTATIRVLTTLSSYPLMPRPDFSEIRLA